MKDMLWLVDIPIISLDCNHECLFMNKYPWYQPFLASQQNKTKRAELVKPTLIRISCLSIWSWKGAIITNLYILSFVECIRESLKDYLVNNYLNLQWAWASGNFKWSLHLHWLQHPHSHVMVIPMATGSSIATFFASFLKQRQQGNQQEVGQPHVVLSWQPSVIQLTMATGGARISVPKWHGHRMLCFMTTLLSSRKSSPNCCC